MSEDGEIPEILYENHCSDHDEENEGDDSFQTANLIDPSGFLFNFGAPIEEAQASVVRDQNYSLKMFYSLPLSMRYFQSPQMVTSLVSIQFQDVGTDVSTVTENWETWASRNHETNIQILQVLNALQVTDASSYALNALKVKWMPGLNTPTLTMAIKGLPLDFCNHNLIEGISMRLQIDTYLEMQVVNGNIGPKLIDRRICPLDIKANSDKRQPFAVTKLNPVLIDTEEDPIYFKVRYVSDLQSKMPLPVLEIPTCLIMYVKQSREDIFTPLVCHPGNLVGFTLAYSRKFCVDPRSIRTLFKHIETTDNQVTHVDDELFSTFANKTFMIRVVSFLNDRHHRVFDIILYDFGLY